MSLFGSILSNVAGLIGTNKKNKQVDAQYKDQQGYAGQQIDLADLIKAAAQRYQQQGSGYTDPFGGGVTYDQATGTWKSTMGGSQGHLQALSDSEEAARMGGDQAIRRFGLGQADQLRQGFAGDADTARRKLALFDQGVGAVDPEKLASSLALNREGAVNAGFDDAQRAANTISLRTGTSAGDTLSRLARSRANAIATTRGDPELEAMNAAEGINNSRQGNLMSRYTGFGDRGRDFSDVGFNPATYGQDATANLFKTQALDNQKFDSTMGAFGTGAGIIGNAASGMRAASGQQMQNRDYFGAAKFIKSTDDAIGNSAGDILKMFGL